MKQSKPVKYLLGSNREEIPGSCVSLSPLLILWGFFLLFVSPQHKHCPLSTIHSVRYHSTVTALDCSKIRKVTLFP